MTLDHSHRGHVHFWARPMTRRSFLGASAFAGAAAASASAWLPQIARADFDGTTSVVARPIPQGVAPFGIPIHHFPPVPVFGPAAINEPSEITDFNGMVGICRVTGMGTGTGGTRYSYQVDNGFMDGLYVGVDGLTHHGTFAFI